MQRQLHEQQPRCLHAVGEHRAAAVAGAAHPGPALAAPLSPSPQRRQSLGGHQAHNQQGQPLLPTLAEQRRQQWQAQLQQAQVRQRLQQPPEPADDFERRLGSLQSNWALAREADQAEWESRRGKVREEWEEEQARRQWEFQVRQAQEQQRWERHRQLEDSLWQRWKQRQLQDWLKRHGLRAEPASKHPPPPPLPVRSQKAAPRTLQLPANGQQLKRKRAGDEADSRLPPPSPAHSPPQGSGGSAAAAQTPLAAGGAALLHHALSEMEESGECSGTHGEPTRSCQEPGQVSLTSAPAASVQIEPPWAERPAAEAASAPALHAGRQQASEPPAWEAQWLAAQQQAWDGERQQLGMGQSPLSPLSPLPVFSTGGITTITPDGQPEVIGTDWVLDFLA